MRWTWIHTPQKLTILTFFVGGFFDAVVASAVTLLVVALALLFANRAPKEQVTAIAAGSVGANAGLLVGYGVGRRRNG